MFEIEMNPNLKSQKPQAGGQGLGSSAEGPFSVNCSSRLKSKDLEVTLDFYI